MPLMQINFVESNPIPVKAAMAMMGLLEEVYRLPMVPPRPASRERIAQVLRDLGLLTSAATLRAMTAVSAMNELESEITALFTAGAGADRDQARDVFARLRAALSAGDVRAAEPDAAAPSGWRVNAWVKQGILLGFRFGDDRRRRRPITGAGRSSTRTRCRSSGSTPAPASASCRADRPSATARISDAASICMPPMYINIGAYVGDETLVDSHALVGSCAQIGRRVHVSAAAQIGGVLEPVGALPVIVEDDVLIGGNCGVYEGAIVKRRAVLAAGTILTGSTPIYDLPNGRIIEPVGRSRWSSPKAPSSCPARGRSRSGAGREWGLSVATPIIVKYRDERTDARTALEAWIR